MIKTFLFTQGPAAHNEVLEVLANEDLYYNDDIDIVYSPTGKVVGQFVTDKAGRIIGIELDFDHPASARRLYEIFEMYIRTDDLDHNIL